MNDLEVLIAEREILRALSRFSRIIDAKNWSGLSEVFAEDIRFDYGMGIERSGLDALRDQMGRFLDDCGPTQHLIGSVLIDIEGDRAASHAYVQARHQRPADPAGPIFDSNGEYIDRWERRSAGWRIVRRDAIWLMHNGDPAILAAGKDDLG